jgi:ATP sulfurylase
MKRTITGLLLRFHVLSALLNYLKSVVNTLRLVDGVLFPIPITLDVSHEDIDRLSIAPGVRIGLRDPRDDEALAIITSSRSFVLQSPILH